MRHIQKTYIPGLHFSIPTRQIRGFKKGKGIGTVILDNGMGGQSSYSSIDDYNSTRNMSGYGLKGLRGLKNKVENLIITPTYRKPKNINFNL